MQHCYQEATDHKIFDGGPDLSLKHVVHEVTSVEYAIPVSFLGPGPAEAQGGASALWSRSLEACKGGCQLA